MAGDSGNMDSPYTALQNGEAGPGERGGEKYMGNEGTRLITPLTSDLNWVLEAKAQWSLAWAIMLTNMSTFSYIVVTVMFVGHLGELELSSAAIANSFATVTGFSVMIGLGSALETLCGQAYGAKEYHRMGIQLQAAWLVTLSFCIPIGVLWWNLEAVLLWLGQDVEISRMAASYCRYTMPGVVSGALFNPLFKFLQTQSLVVLMLVCAATTAVLHPGVCYLFIYHLGFGYAGGAIANAFSYWLLLILLVCFTVFSGKCAQTWGGFRFWEAVQTTPVYFKLAVPSVIMLCLKLWSFEMLLLMSGLLPNPTLELSLLSIALNTSSFLFMIPFGFSGAVSTRVSNALGGNRPAAAKLAVQVVLCLATVLASVLFIFLIIVRNWLGSAYTDVPEVLEYFAAIVPLLAVSTFVDGIQGVLSGVIRGCGRQTLGAVINLGAFYCFGMPLAVVLGFYFQLNSTGLLIGLACGISLQTGLLIFYILCTDWEKMAEEAQDRLHLGDGNPHLPSYLERLQAENSR